MNTDRRDDELLDETLEETFPASDPPANTVETGIRLQWEPGPVRDNRDASRFELNQDEALAFLVYERRPDTLVLIHTDVPASLQGQHAGAALVQAAIAAAESEGRRIEAVCPFVREYLRKHPI